MIISHQWWHLTTGGGIWPPVVAHFHLRWMKPGMVSPLRNNQNFIFLSQLLYQLMSAEQGNKKRKSRAGVNHKHSNLPSQN